MATAHGEDSLEGFQRLGSGSKRTCKGGFLSWSGCFEFGSLLDLFLGFLEPALALDFDGAPIVLLLPLNDEAEPVDAEEFEGDADGKESMPVDELSAILFVFGSAGVILASSSGLTTFAVAMVTFRIEYRISLSVLDLNLKTSTFY